MALRGKTVAFTGTFENMNRNAVVKAAKRAGAIVPSHRGATVSKNVDFLVTGESNVGIKKVKAKQLGITVVPPQSFLKFVGAGGAARVATARQPRAVEDFEEDYEEEETSAAMPWETDAAPTRRAPRRVAPATRRQPVAEVEFEEDYEEETSAKQAMSAIRGKNLAFTGTFENMNRAEVVKAAKRAGALVPSHRGASMSNNVDVLVTGDSNVAPRKKAHANQLGVRVLPAHSFVKFVRGGAPRRVAPATRRQPVAKVEFEEDYEEESSGAMPWETEAAPARGRARMVAAPKARRQMQIERPVRKTRTTMAVERPAPRAAARSAYVPFWNLRSKTVSFTGSFEQVKKTEATVMAERNGATVTSALNHTVDILVCGKGSEGKRMLAKKKGIMAVSEKTFIAACRK